MGSLIRRTFAILSIVWLALFWFSTQAAAQSDGDVGFIKKPVADPVASGVCGTAPLYTYVDPPDGGYGGPTYSNLTWTWSATGASTVWVDTSSSEQNPTLKYKVCTPGNYSISLKVTATWDVSTGGTVSASGTATLDLSVVGVAKLQTRVDKYSYADVSGTLYVLLGESLDFQAVSTPDGSTFPDGQPVWSVDSKAIGSGSITFSTLSTKETDYKTVTATCGNTSMTANVIVYDLTPVLTPQDNFEGRDLDYYGVCEFIDLSFTTTPTGISVSNIGGLTALCAANDSSCGT